MRICIYGAGATGGNLAVRLVQAGHDVSVVARGAQLQAIRDNGLRLIAGEDEVGAEVAASDAPGDLGGQDLVIVATKATALAAVADGLGPLVGPATAVMFWQNGVPWWYPQGGKARLTPPDLAHFALSRDFYRTITPGQVIGATIFSSNEVIAPGVIRNASHGHNRLAMGAITPDSPVDVAGLRALIESTGFSCPVPREEDIRWLIWPKVVFNMSGSTLALVTGGRAAAIREDAEIQALFRTLMAEGFAIARAYGYDVEPDTDVDRIIAQAPDHRPSMAQDFDRGRAMEVAEIVRAPQAFARAAGLSTPALDTLCTIATRLARNRGLFG